MLTCGNCSKTFMDITKFDDHCQNNCLLCSKCGKQFDRMPLYVTHIGKCSGSKAILCHKCGSKFEHMVNFNKHAAANWCICQQCGRKFTQEHDSKTHFMVHNTCHNIYFVTNHAWNDFMSFKIPTDLKVGYL